MENSRIWTLILTNVAPSLLWRLPDKIKADPYDLWHHLEENNQAFRFLDLPAELRERVYEEYIGETSYGLQLQQCNSAILQVCREIRREARPIFFSKGNFAYKLSFSDLDLNEPWIKASATIRDWVDNVAGADASSLRSFDIFYAYNQDYLGAIHFSFSERNGLQVELPEKLSAQSKDKFQQYIARTEANRKFLELKGESISLAILSNPDLWKLDVLWPEHH